MKNFNKLINKETVKLAGGILTSLSVFTAVSHPESPLNKKLPSVALKRVSFLPHIKIHGQAKYVHIHHWIIFGTIYIIGLITKKRNFFSYKLINGLLLGGFLQGILYADRLKIIVEN